MKIDPLKERERERIEGGLNHHRRQRSTVSSISSFSNGTLVALLKFSRSKTPFRFGHRFSRWRSHGAKPLFFVDELVKRGLSTNAAFQPRFFLLSTTFPRSYTKRTFPCVHVIPSRDFHTRFWITFNWWNGLIGSSFLTRNRYAKSAQIGGTNEIEGNYFAKLIKIIISLKIDKFRFSFLLTVKLTWKRKRYFALSISLVYGRKAIDSHVSIFPSCIRVRCTPL